jgi:hypothetical protein
VDLNRYPFTFDPRKKGLRKILGDLEADVVEAIEEKRRRADPDV